MSHGLARYSPDVSYTSAEKTRAPISKKIMPHAMKLKISSSVAGLPGESSAPSRCCLRKIKNAVAKAKMYISPYQRNKPKKGTPGKISGLIHDG